MLYSDVNKARKYKANILVFEAMPESLAGVVTLKLK